MIRQKGKEIRSGKLKIAQIQEAICKTDIAVTELAKLLIEEDLEDCAKRVQDGISGALGDKKQLLNEEELRALFRGERLQKSTEIAKTVAAKSAVAAEDGRVDNKTECGLADVSLVSEADIAATEAMVPLLFDLLDISHDIEALQATAVQAQKEVFLQEMQVLFNEYADLEALQDGNTSRLIRSFHTVKDVQKQIKRAYAIVEAIKQMTFVEESGRYYSDAQISEMSR